MFVNEYVMTRRRYTKWATPKFWKLRSFYLWVIILQPEYSGGSILIRHLLLQDGKPLVSF